MAKKPANHRKEWTNADDRKLIQFIRQNTPTRLIAHKLQRTEDAIRSKASEKHLSLKPTNQSPYNRRRK